MSAFRELAGAPAPRIAHPTYPWIYLRGFLGRILSQTLFALLLIESIFIADKLNDIIVTVLDQRAPISDIPIFILLRMPDVFGLALPIAVLIASYQVALQARENREFQVFAGIGVSAQRMVGVAWLVGCLAMLVSLANSGLVAPASKYAMRYRLFDARHAALYGAASPGVFFGFGDYTIFVPPNTGGDEARPLYIHQQVPSSNDTERVIIADGGRLEGLFGSGSKILHLQNPTILNFFKDPADSSLDAGRLASCSDCTRASHATINSVFQAQRIAQDVDLGALNTFPPRGSDVAESSLPDLLTGASALTSERMRAIELGRRIGRALLCLITPLLAGVALVITGRLNHALAVSAAVGAVFGLDLALASLAEITGALGLLPVMGAVAAPIAIVALAVNLVARYGKVDLIMPMLARG